MTRKREKPRRLEGIRTVLLDVDDTLWENNLFFNQVHAWLCRQARLAGFTDRAIHQIMHDLELSHIKLMGFGYDSYERSLLGGVRRISHGGTRGGDHAGLHRRAREWVHFLRHHPMHLLEGVAEAMPLLHSTHRTILVTKGSHRDQMSKVHRSGLLPHVHEAEVVRHKTPEEYREVIRKFDLDPETTVMVGNSPKSDINSAKAAGLHTIYVPHPQTWYLELEPIRNDVMETVEVRNFREVLWVLGLLEESD